MGFYVHLGYVDADVVLLGRLARLTVYGPAYAGGVCTGAGKARVWSAGSPQPKPGDDDYCHYGLLTLGGESRDGPGIGSAPP